VVHHVVALRHRMEDAGDATCLLALVDLLESEMRAARRAHSRAYLLNGPDASMPPTASAPTHDGSHPPARAASGTRARAGRANARGSTGSPTNRCRWRARR